MLLVETELGESKIAGIGLFWTKDIKAGTVIWKHNEHTCKIWSKEEYEKVKEDLPKTAMDNMGRFVYLNNGKYYLDLDDSRFMNHSDNPSMGWKEDNDLYCYALKDLKAGSELTLDYNDFCDEEDLINCDYVQAK